MMRNYTSNQEAFVARIQQLIQLYESRQDSLEKITNKKGKVNKCFEQDAHDHVFQKGDMVLLWDKKNEKPGKHGKFDSLWLGPCLIDEVAGNNSFFLDSTIKGLSYK